MASFSASTLLNGSRVVRVVKPLCENSGCCRAIAAVARLAARLTRSDSSVVTRWFSRRRGTSDFEGLQLLMMSSAMMRVGRSLSHAVSVDAARESSAGQAVSAVWSALSPSQRARFLACAMLTALAVHVGLNPGSLRSVAGALGTAIVAAAAAILWCNPEAAVRGWAEWSARRKLSPRPR